MSASASLIGGDVLLRNIVAFGGGFMNHVNNVMEEIESMLREAIRKNISLTDHSLKDLAALGHPYAAAHPSNPHTPEYQVHTQGGAMLGALYSGTSKAALGGTGGAVQAEAFAGIQEAIQYALFVLYGTSKMIPRDFLNGSLEEIKDQVFSVLTVELRDAVINFNGEKIST